MRDIAFLAHRLPYPPDRGDRIRSWHILRHLAARMRVHLVAFSDTDLPPKALLSCCASIRLVPHRRGKITAITASLFSGRPSSVEYFRDRRFADAVADLLRSTPMDCIYAFSGQMAQYVPADRGDMRFVMDFVDVDSAKFHEYAKTASRASAIAFAWEAKRLRRFEQRVAARADASLFVSRAEADLFQRRSAIDDGRIHIIRNGVDLDGFHPDFAGRPDAPDAPLIVFTGQMDYRPNVDAVTRFASDVLPLVQQTCPDAHFAIVGRNPTAAVRALQRVPNVIVTGEVRDVRPWMAAANLIIAPLRIARGVQNKLLEALAMGRPVLASSAAALGLDLRPDEEILIADAPDAQAAAITEILGNPMRAAALGQAARGAMEARYGWAHCLTDLPDLVLPAPLWPAVAA